METRTAEIKTPDCVWTVTLSALITTNDQEADFQTFQLFDILTAPLLFISVGTFLENITKYWLQAKLNWN